MITVETIYGVKITMRICDIIMIKSHGRLTKIFIKGHENPIITDMQHDDFIFSFLMKNIKGNLSSTI
ncbi:hypothetical protein KP17_10665 [Pectobacterium parvum]|nr:hypothetical protein KP17_10665 [Pectobacterium parvum]KHS98539.1 hypothetical protein RC88_03265 [Pectobacterium parvum]